MASTNFINGVTVVQDTWLNDVDECVYVTVPALENDVINLQGDVTQLQVDVPALDTALDNYIAATASASSLAFSRRMFADLREGLDAVYGAGAWTQRTGIGTGSDIGAALTYVLTNSPAGVPVHIPPGVWLMSTAPSAALLAGRHIFGTGSQNSKVVWNSASGTPFNFTGHLGNTGGGITGLGIILEQNLGDTTAVAITLAGDATHQPDQIHFEDLYITAMGPTGAGSSYWNTCISANGTARTVTQGIRVGTMKNIQCFRAHGLGALFWNTVQWSIENLGIYVSKGAGQNIYVGGGGTGPTNTTQFYARGLSCVAVNVTNASKFEISGSFTSFETAVSATSGRVLGFGAALVGTLGTNVVFTPA